MSANGVVSPRRNEGRARRGRPRARERRGPLAGKRLRIGFIGCGGNARGHGRRVTQMAETELVALADVSDAAISAFKEAVPGAHDVPVFNDYEKMLDLVRMDAVEISTPHTLH